MNVDTAELFVGALRWAINEARDNGAASIDLTGKMASITAEESAAILRLIGEALASPSPDPVAPVQPSGVVVTLG